MFNLCTLCIQSIRCKQQKLWYKLNPRQCMHYLRAQNPFEEKLNKKIAKFKMLSFYQKLFSGYHITSCKHLMSLHCVKYQNVPEKKNRSGIPHTSTIKQYVELQRAVTLKELNTSPHYFVYSKCPSYQCV